MHAKVKAGGVAGSVSILIVWLAGQAGVEVPPEVASALTTVLAAAAGWLR